MNITKEADTELTSGNQFLGKGNIGVGEWEVETIGYKAQKSNIQHKIANILQ